MVYEVTIDLERDTFYYYKFRIGLTDGNWQGFWEGIPGDCGYGEYFDRSFTTSNLDNQIVGPFVLIVVIIVIHKTCLLVLMG